MNSKFSTYLTIAALALISAAAVQAQPDRVGSALDSIAVPVAVQDEVARVRAQGAFPAATPLPEEWQQVAAIRAAQTGRPVADLVDEVRQALRPSPALVPAAENRSQDAGAIRGGPTPIITVGGEGDSFCNFLATATNNGLQQAMDAAAGDANGAELTEIRVANGGDYISKNYIVNGAVDQTVRIIGGYASCGAATPTLGAVTTLDGSGPIGVPVLLIDQVTAAQTVYLENLRLINGSGFNGGGLEIRNNNVVIGTSLLVANNAGNNGGGINLLDVADADPTVLWLLAGSSVLNNTAGINGGGIYCQGGTDSGVVLDTAVALSSNSATNNGGGFYLNGCALVSFASLPAGIFFNSASFNGGGGYIASGARATLIGGESFGFGDASRRTTLDSNSANASGGGLFVSGAGSFAQSADSWIAGNTADADSSGSAEGGGVALQAGTHFLMFRTGSACHNPDRCSQLSGNSAVNGGAVSARGDGVSVDIRQTWIENNRNSADGLGSAVFVSNLGGDLAQPGTLFMEGDMIVGNPPAVTTNIRGVVDVQSNTNTTIAFTTFADNLQDTRHRDLIAFNNTNVNVYSNIFWESIGQIFLGNWDTDTQGAINCALVFENATLPPSASAVTVADPQFVPPPTPFGVNTYHLSATSPAVDYCDTLFYTPQENDIDDQPRGFDVADIPDQWGLFDLGADEFRNVLFADGFETTP